MKQLHEYRRDAWNCYRDSMCKYVFTWHINDSRFSRMCPSLIRYHFDAYSAQGRLDLARAMIEGEVEYSDKLLDVIYRCQLCGGCDYVCGRVKEIQPGRIIQAMRAKLVDEGQAPPAEFRQLMQDMRDYQNPYQQNNSQRAAWIDDWQHAQDADIPLPSENSRTDSLLYIGCSPLRDQAAQRMPKTVATLLMRAGYPVGILGDRERCCGNPCHRVGDQVEFVAFATENIKMFNKMGIKKLICICPFCYSTFRRDYPHLGEPMNFRVVHALDVIADLLAHGRLKPNKKNNLRVTYHDPCHLGRISDDGVSGTGVIQGLYEAPRRILKAIPGVELQEMSRIKDDSLCCGAGGWIKSAYPDFAQSTALERLDEAKSTRCQALVTHCPHCEENFCEATANNKSSLRILNLLDLLLESL